MMFKRSPLVDSFYGINTNPHRWCYFGSSSSKSTPVINQPGLTALNANFGQANNVANSLGTYGGLLSAPLAGNQMQAINAAPQMGQIGAPQLNFAANTDANLTGYRAPQAGAAYAAPGLLGGAATYNPSMLGAAPMATAASAAPGLVGSAATAAPGLAGSAATANSPSISGLMGGFMSPYTQNVVNTTNAQIEQQRQRAAMANNQDATAAGAFGGNRQGVSDALTNQLYDLDTAQTDAQLNQAGFNTALQGATQQAANNLNAGQFNAGQQNQIGLFNAGNQQEANLFNAGQQNQFGLFNAGNQQQSNLFNAGNVQETNLANQGLAGIYGQANQGAANTAGAINAGALNTALGINAGNVQQANLTNAGAANNMAQFNVGSNLAGAGIQQNAANSLAGASGQMQQQFGNYISALLNTGQIDQATVQNNLSNLYNQFLQQQQTAIQGQGLVNQSLGLQPINLGNNQKSSGFQFTLPMPGH